MTRGHVNLHTGLRAGQLKQRYLRLRDEVLDEELEDDRWEYDYDDYWDPWDPGSSLDFELVQLWQDALASDFAVDVELVASTAPPSETAVLVDPDRLPEALHEHVVALTSPETRQQAIARARLAAPREQLRLAMRCQPLRHWLARHRGPATMLLLLSPFWLRSPASWVPPDDADDDATQSLVTHLFGRYAIPRVLVRPWTGTELPSLKWASWLVLIGGGASLRRAAPRFGWRISRQLVPHLFDAPVDEPLEAVMWAELVQRGGTDRELARLRRDPAYVFDVTATELPGLVLEDEREPQARDHDGFRAFWLATVDWLVRYRDELDDDLAAAVLAWAVHRHAEDAAHDTPPHARFTWTGRTPAGAREPAVAYRRDLQVQAQARRYPQNFSWRGRGWDAKHAIGEHVWSAHELTTSWQLAEETAAMSHCVWTYAYRCVQGSSAIFSIRRDGARACTVELEPSSRRVAQARGPHNRTCTPQELAFVAHWLAELASRLASGPAC